MVKEANFLPVFGRGASLGDAQQSGPLVLGDRYTCGVIDDHRRNNSSMFCN